MEYKLCDDTWGGEEKAALMRVIESGMYTMGENVRGFEARFAEKFHTRYAVMVNSGSSANLLAVAAMVYSKRLSPGDEVLVPAVSWSTTFFPLAQFGLKIRFVDIDRDTLNIDVSKLEEAITTHTKMVFLVNLLGNPNDFDAVAGICGSKGIAILEDNCEALGGMYKNRRLGTLGCIGTFSTFYSHHLCTMEGGVAVTDDEELYHYMLCIRAHGWTRDLPEESRIYTKGADDFYERFHFIVPGFNLRPLELEAAAGLKQLEKMDGIIAARRENAKYFCRLAGSIAGIRIQKEIETSSWFGFAIVLEGRPGIRDAVIHTLTEHQIETRPVVAGNFTRNQACAYLDYTVSGPLRNADELHDNGFFIGNHSKDNRSGLEYVCGVLSRCLSGM